MRTLEIAGTMLICAAAALAQDFQPKDFSKTNSVTIRLADAEAFLPIHGLTHAYSEADGVTILTNVLGVPCRMLTNAVGLNKAFVYFAIDPTFKRQEVSSVKVDVEYFDGFEGHLGVMGLEFDSSEFGSAPNAAYKPQLPNIPLNGSKKWMKGTFRIRDGTFRNSQNAGSDFRLWASPPELFVSRVTVTLDPPKEGNEPKPLVFDAKSEAKLTNWNVQWDIGSADTKPSFAMGTNDGLRWLEIKAGKNFGRGSWRTSVLLDPGQYQFVARARLEGNSDGGVGLRASMRDRPAPIRNARDWTNLTYNFEMSATDYIELVAEFHGGKGSARFDADSLKLIRKSKAE